MKKIPNPSKIMIPIPIKRHNCELENVASVVEGSSCVKAVNTSITTKITPPIIIMMMLIKNKKAITVISVLFL